MGTAAGDAEDVLAGKLDTVCSFMDNGGRGGSTVLERALVAASVLPKDTSAPRELGEGDAGEQERAVRWYHSS